MSDICIIDDDFAAEALAEALSATGHTVRRIPTAADALASVDDIAKADLVVVDVMMARPEGLAEAATHGGHRTGLVIAQELRQRRGDLRIVGLTANQDPEVHRWFTEQGRTAFISKLSCRSLRDVVSRIEDVLGEPSQPDLLRVFIVHGHDDATKLAVKNYLQNTLHLPEPIILHEQPSAGRLLLEKFEFYSGKADVAFVLLTPDDVGTIVDSPNETKRRARQNVVLELGYFLGVFGRSSGRVFLLHKGQLELPSDIAGLIYTDISAGLEAAGETIRRELAHVLTR